MKNNASISYQAIDVSMPTLKRRLLKHWIEETVSQRGFDLGELNYLFCNDEEILKNNREFLNHDYYTDVISFDNSSETVVAGDILISLDTVRSNAKLYDVSYSKELLRVMIHGVLHFCGLKDDTDESASAMRMAENEALERWIELSSQ